MATFKSSACVNGLSGLGSLATWVGAALLAGGLIASEHVSAQAATCPFDDGNSSLAVEGVVLTRYALGITGAPLVASTGINAVDAPTVEAAINCPSCGLNITGNPTMTVADATIISRKIAGFSGAALTNGVALGSGTRNTPTAVQSFLLAGCGAAGDNAFVNGGNAFGVNAVLGTNDGKDLFVKSSGLFVEVSAVRGAYLKVTQGDGSTNAGLQVIRSTDPGTINVLNGSAANRDLSGPSGVTVAGGGNSSFSCFNASNGNFPDSCRNTAFNDYATASGGIASNALGYGSVVAGGRSNYSINTLSVVSGGDENLASGVASTVPGGFSNTASGLGSFAAGQRAVAGDGTFVWNSYNTTNNLPTRTDSFRVQAANGFDVNYGRIKQYYFAMNADTPGFIVTTSTGVGLSNGGVWTSQSDRAKKREFAPINARDVLRKVVALPLSTWSYLAEEASIRHMGPMAQDFWKAFGLGYGDKTMNDVDSRGVAFAAIQGLNQKLIEQSNAKDAKISALEKANAVMLREMQAIKMRLGM